MFEIRVTCAPAESEGILAALSDVFHTKDVNHLPAGHADKERLYLTGEHRPQDTRPTMWQHVQTVVAWLNISNANTSHETAMRLLKVTEEAGEAVQAYLGAAGQNPARASPTARTTWPMSSATSSLPLRSPCIRSPTTPKPS